MINQPIVSDIEPDTDIWENLVPNSNIIGVADWNRDTEPDDEEVTDIERDYETTKQKESRQRTYICENGESKLEGLITHYNHHPHYLPCPQIEIQLQYVCIFR